ncbi:MAG: TIGR02206 family membrane protein [Chthoniobacter sp.]|nr:TIGR02206 family membrane protein [Chthoniobacter sp.]
MSLLQLGSLALAFLGPVVLWALHRRRPHPVLERNFACGIAGLLVVVIVAMLVQKAFDGTLTWREALPMQLCDWALFAVVVALLRRSQTCFEVGYFWGLCGTLQALFTPAIGHDLEWWRQVAFFLDHALIVAGVLFLLLVPKMRPQGLLRVVLWSEVYLVAALAVNALTGGNYGFLSHRPAQASMLDLFSDTRWLYVAEINAIALVFFAAIWLPWRCVRRN